MNEQTNSVIIKSLDTESKFHYLNYYYSKMSGAPPLAHGFARIGPTLPPPGGTGCNIVYVIVIVMIL